MRGERAQRMQENLKRAQEEIARIEVTGQAGGGMVSVTMNGRHEVRRVSIDRKILADIAVRDAGTFGQIAEVAKSA